MRKHTWGSDSGGELLTCTEEVDACRERWADATRLVFESREQRTTALATTLDGQRRSPTDSERKSRRDVVRRKQVRQGLGLRA